MKYIEGLEALADDKPGSAVGEFQELRAQFPQSLYADKAESYLYSLQNRKNNGGIVPFYLGNLATATYSSMMFPSIFDYELDAVLGGITGLAGVAGGLTSAWLMSRNHPISPDQDWWIEGVEVISLGNYLYASAIIDWSELFDDDSLANRN